MVRLAPCSRLEWGDNVTTLGPYELNTIITGDARELAKAIPDESVDLVFCDPVYDRIDDYRWLAETAARVLKPDGNALAFVNSKWITRITKQCHTINPLLALVIRNGPAPLNGRVISKVHHLLWFGSGKLVGYMPDFWQTTRPWSRINTHNHKWTKDPNYIKTVFNAFTYPGATIFDPFTGGGVIPAVCKMLHRNYLAFEIDPETADMARKRVAETQPPLPLVMPEQLELI